MFKNYVSHELLCSPHLADDKNKNDDADGKERCQDCCYNDVPWCGTRGLLREATGPAIGTVTTERVHIIYTRGVVRAGR